MNKIMIIFFCLFIYNCSKPKTVLICGDHACINKSEAEQFFEENLSIEVRIFDAKKKDTINLVELNLNRVSKDKKIISVSKKTETSKEIKSLSNDEIDKIKNKIKQNKKSKKLLKKVDDIDKKPLLEKKQDELIDKKKRTVRKKNYKNNNEIVDVCSILEKCSISEISKYLIEQDEKKDYPDISLKE